jgi:hypothetical protein
MLEKRKVATSFLDESRLLERLDPLERAYLDSAITKYDAGVLNSDARPVSATYAVARWAKHFESGRLLSALVGRITPLTCVIGLAAFALIAVPVLVRAAGSPWGSIPGALTLYAMGLTVMFTQVLTIVAFQIVSGYVYGWIAALIAAFMLGLGLASGYVGSRRVGWTWYHLAALAAGLAGLPLVAAGILRYAGTGAAAAPHLIDACFMGLAFASGALGGTVFAAASDFIVRRGGALVEAGVLAYSLDLAGATVAGFTTGFLIIPSLGIAGSAYAVAAFNGALVAARLVWGALRAGRS